MEDKIIKLKSEHMTLGDVEALISESLGEAVKSVIAIGYHLKYIRDHKLYQEAGYLDIWSYAHGRYGFSKSTTSRYISRNDKFSKGGNSLILDERYQDYGKAQLQEMLSLDEEQLEQVTPDMTTRQIREMKKPKEAPEPCIEIPGQIEMDLEAEDAQPAEEPDKTLQEELSAYGTPRIVYPEGSLIRPEGCEDGDWCSSCALDCRIRQGYRYCVEAPLGAPFPCSMMDQMGALRDDLGDRCQFVNTDLADHCAGNGAPDPCCEGCDEVCDHRCPRAEKTTPEPKEEAVATSQQDKRSSCPPQVPGCRRQEWGTSPEQQQAGQKECDKCWAEWEDRQRLLGAAGTQQDLAEAVVEELVASTIEDTKDTDSMAEDDGPVSDPAEGVSDPGESTSGGAEDPEEEDVGSEQPVKTYDKAILEEMIKDCEGKLETMGDYWAQHLPDTYTKYKMQIRAYKDLLAAGGEEEQAEEPIEQPPLPVLKNDDQRKAWLDKYREWPVWFEVPQASEVYYRYDLEDGYSLVICEYQYYVRWMEKMGDMSPERTGTREYLLIPGHRYLHDCLANRTALIEHLKKMKRKG